MLNIKNIDTVTGSLGILEDYDTDRWNSLAERTNTRSFIEVNGYEPANYEEVKAWIQSFIS